VASLGPGGDAVTLLDALAVGGARAYLRNAEGGHAIALMHASPRPWRSSSCCPGWRGGPHAAVAYAWQAVAAIHVAYDVDRTLPSPTMDPPPPTQLIERRR
jgi:hypothetical protein